MYQFCLTRVFVDDGIVSHLFFILCLNQKSKCEEKNDSTHFSFILFIKKAKTMFWIKKSSLKWFMLIELFQTKSSSNCSTQPYNNYCFFLASKKSNRQQAKKRKSIENLCTKRNCQRRLSREMIICCWSPFLEFLFTLGSFWCFVTLI